MAEANQTDEPRAAVGHKQPSPTEALWQAIWFVILGLVSLESATSRNGYIYLIVAAVFLGIAVQRGYGFLRSARKNKSPGHQEKSQENGVPVPEPCQTIEIYRRTIAVLPRPSESQIDGFVEFVSRAHSWYKHLPLIPPGVPFHFFLNPHVACDMKVISKRGIEYRRREKTGFHYSEWPTSEYLKQCGYLDYRCLEPVGTLVMPIGGPAITKGILAHIKERTAAESRTAEVPKEILSAGTMELTGIIHPYASNPRLWHWRFRHGNLEKAQWPLETGGKNALVRVVDIAQRSALNDLGEEESYFHQIDALIDPERRRLKRLMRDTVNRMLELVYGPSKK